MVEFALVAPLFFYLLFACVELAIKSLQQTELDNFLMHAYGELAKSSAGAADRDAYLQTLCTDGPVAILSCDKVVFGSQVVSSGLTEWQNTTINGLWDYGCANDIIILEMLYPVTNLLHSFSTGEVVTISGNDFFRSRGVIRREPMLIDGATC